MSGLFCIKFCIVCYQNISEYELMFEDKTMEIEVQVHSEINVNFSKPLISPLSLFSFTVNIASFQDTW